MQDYEELDDLELMKLLQQGNDEAFDVIQCRYQEKIRSYIYRRVLHFHDTEDLTQNTFMRVWVYRNEFLLQDFKAWIYKIAGNLVRNYYRTQGREILSNANNTGLEEDSEEFFLEIIDPNPSPLDKVVIDDQISFIDACLDDTLVKKQNTEYKRRLVAPH